jgi:hypothetical protein
VSPFKKRVAFRENCEKMLAGSAGVVVVWKITKGNPDKNWNLQEKFQVRCGGVATL